MGRAVNIAMAQGRFTKLAAHARLPNSVLSIADQIVASATTFLTGALIGRACAKEEFGYYALGFSLLTFLITVQASLISTPFMIRFPRLEGHKARKLAGSSLVHQCMLGGTLSALVIVSGLVAAAFESPLAPMLIALGVALSFLLLRDYVRQMSFARLAYARALALDMLLATLQLAGLTSLYVSDTLEARTAFLVLGAASAITAIHWLLLTRGERLFLRASIREDLTRNWAAAKWFFGSGLLWALSMNLYAWIVAGFHGAASAGAWASALGVMTLINPLMIGIQNYLGPRIMHACAQGGVTALRKTVNESAVSFCAVLLGFTVIMSFTGDSLVVFIYGAKYAGNGPLVDLLSLNAAVMAVGFAVSRGLFALEMPQVDFYVNLAAFLCFVIFGVALTRAAGPLGAAIAQLATNIVATVVRCIVFTRATAQAEELAR